MLRRRLLADVNPALIRVVDVSSSAEDASVLQQSGHVVRRAEPVPVGAQRRAASRRRHRHRPRARRTHGRAPRECDMLEVRQTRVKIVPVTKSTLNFNLTGLQRPARRRSALRPARINLAEEAERMFHRVPMFHRGSTQKIKIAMSCGKRKNSRNGER